MRKNPVKFGQSLLASAALAGLLCFTTAAPRLRADEGECQHRTAAADHRLHEAIEHHGWDSKEAEHARRELRDVREHCWSEYHKWWDEDSHSWHTDHDWDDDHGHPH